MRQVRGRPALLLFLASAFTSTALTGCEAPPPDVSSPGSGGTSTEGGFCAATPAPSPVAEDLESCAPLVTDYQPRAAASALDEWPACISDDGAYHRINPTISTIARVAAFESMAELLWRRASPPSPDDFLRARAVYAQEQGLSSRMDRREDIRVAPPPGGARCSDPGIAAAHPDRCVGPAKLQPLLNEAFTRGAAASAPHVQSARIEAALVWFLYVSVLSEVTSCSEKPQDCDSAWAYYGGGGERATPLGLGAMIRSWSEPTHDRAYDGLLAVRCWRNLDNEAGGATDLARRDVARAQVDRAMRRGLARIVLQRLAELGCTSGEVKRARWEFVRVLLPLLHGADLAVLASAELPTDDEVADLRLGLEREHPCP